MILLFQDCPIPQGEKDKPKTCTRQRLNDNTATSQFLHAVPMIGVKGGCCCLIQKNIKFCVCKGAV